MGRNKGQPKSQTKVKNERTKEQQELAILIDKLLRLSTTQAQNTAKALETQKEINAITEKVIDLESILVNSLGSVDKRQQADTKEIFTAWVKENGGKFEGSSIAEFPGYDLGLKADIDIPQDSLIIAIPRKIMMTVEAANKTSLRNLIEKDNILKNMPNVVLAVFLLFEKFKGDSFWKPYIDILPKTYSTVLYFSVSELEELQGSPTLESALKQIKSITRQYAYFHTLISTSDDEACKMLRKNFTFEEYRWAVSTVMTRQNTIPSKDDGERVINALIPLWDLCNHTNGTISTDYNPEQDRSECSALRDFNAGEQLFIFYGARSNSDLFIHNGFVYEDNECDHYCLKLGISKSDPLQQKRTDLLNRLNLQPNGDFWIQKGPRPLTGQLIAFLRVFSMTEGQLEQWLESGKPDELQNEDCPIDKALQEKSLSFLQTRLQLLMRAYKTTLEEDLKLLSEDNNKFSNMNLAVRMRITEKKILKNSLDYIENKLRV